MMFADMLLVGKLLIGMFWSVCCWMSYQCWVAPCLSACLLIVFFSIGILVVGMLLIDMSLFYVHLGGILFVGVMLFDIVIVRCYSAVCQANDLLVLAGMVLNLLF